MKKNTNAKAKKKENAVILLEDLAPRKDVKGGSGKLLFGERVEDSKEESRKKKASKRDQRSASEADG